MGIALGKREEVRDTVMNASTTNRILTPSRYNHMFTLEEEPGKTLLYNSSSGALVVIDDEIAEALYSKRSGDIPAEAVNDLSTGRFLISAGVDELLSVYHDTMALWYGSNYTRISVAPTMECNFECSYCFQGVLENRPPAMNKTTMNKTIDFAKKLAKNTSGLYLSWFGGEPLLVPDLIVEADSALKNWAEKQSMQFSSSVTTNGYLLTRDIVDMLVANGISHANVTLDGLQEVHDSRRKLLGGQGTFDVIVANLRYAVTKMKVTIRANVDRDNSSYIGLLLQFLAQQDIVGHQKADFYLGHVNPFGQYSRCMTDHEFVNYALNWYGDHEGHSGVLFNVPTPVTNCLAHTFRAFAVDSQGFLYKCLEVMGDEKEAVGSVCDESLQFNRELQRWVALDPFQVEKCRACNILPSCRGGCPRRWLVEGEPNCGATAHELGRYIKSYFRHSRARALRAGKESAAKTGC